MGNCEIKKDESFQAITAFYIPNILRHSDCQHQTSRWINRIAIISAEETKRCVVFFFIRFGWSLIITVNWILFWDAATKLNITLMAVNSILTAIVI